MLMNAVPFEQAWLSLRKNDSAFRASALSFIRFIEKKLGARFVLDGEKIPYDDLSLQPALDLYEALKKSGAILTLERRRLPVDMPHLFVWRAKTREGEEQYASGCSAESNEDALVRTIAESLERHLWFEEEDLLKAGIVATEQEIASRGRALALDRIAGLSPEQKKKIQSASKTGAFLWVPGISLVSRSQTWLPAQLVSANKAVGRRIGQNEERYLRNTITTGMATHTSQLLARLSGILEGLERDAFMIMWLNQLSCRRIDATTMRGRSPAFERLLRDCARYRLVPHFIEMPTDAPTHAVCAIIEDTQVKSGRYSIGAKAAASFSCAAEGALLEALRTHSGRLARINEQTEPVTKEAVRHLNRTLYWAQEGKDTALDFLVKGPLVPYETRPWSQDTPEEHYAGLIAWCEAKNYECISFSFTNSPKNTTPWHVEFLIIPELQSMYFNERLPQTSGVRLVDVPKMYGYTPRATPFTDEPHPFA